MANKRITPPKHRPSVAQLADVAVIEAFRESFNKFFRSTAKLHPKNRSWRIQFYRAWREQLAWAEHRL